jgi:polysaccharide biosynthesis/export protein
MNRLLPTVVALVLLLAATVSSAAGQATKSPSPSSVAPQVQSQPASPGYVIAPGDMLEIQVWKEPEISKTVPVRPDGKISVPLLNDVQAAGLTAPALTTDLTEKLKKFISDPQVTVIVTQVNSERIYITGEVNRGGAFPLVSGMTVLQALASAGGFTSFANPKKVYVLRQENGKPVKYPFNYKEVINGKNPEENIVLKAGDTIVVP